MPLSPFFLHGSPSEQRLVQDLVNEHLQLFGQDVLYLPRKIVNENTVIREITASKFDDSFRLEAYLVNTDGFGTPSDVLTKFGVQSQDEVTLVVSKERYDDFIAPFIKLFPEGERKNANTPNEGDLIYLPLDNAIFEIKYIERKVPFYQVNDLFMYEFRCEIFQPEDEVIDLPDGLTDKDGVDIDESMVTKGQVITIQMETEETDNALATVSLASTITGVKSVQYIKLFDDGNYLGTPTVTVHKPGQGNAATGSVTIAEGAIDSVSITSSGSNYLKVPTVSFTPPNKTTSSQIKFGNNSLAHTATTDVIGANFHFTSNVDSRDSGNGRLSLSFWYYPTKFDVAVNGATVMWTDRFKIYQRETGNIVFASGSGSIENTTQLNLNQWNFIRVEQYNTDATISVNGTASNTLNTANPIMFFAGDVLKLGADTAGAGFIPTQKESFEGYLDHLTLNLTGDNATSATSATQVPTSETQQETDASTSTSAQFVNKLDNEYPVVNATIDSNRVVSSLTIVSEGWGYTSVPIMTIESPATGTQATAVAIMTSRSGIQNQAVDRILLTNPGTGYTTPPQVVFTGGNPVNNGVAIATAIISEAVLGPVAITTGGQGYNFTPTVGITSVWHQQSNETAELLWNAKAEAVVSSANSVTEIRYSNAGAGYTSINPVVSISSVTSNSFGEYEVDEVIKGLNTGTEAYVASWDSTKNILKVSIPSGDFAIGEVVVGAGASYRIQSIQSEVDGDREFAQNETFEFEADQILDFSERNPFGEF
tara:strand:- start:304 stop:2601 length:2298 start_codon:yes stop_codon:yes gene_type:complete